MKKKYIPIGIGVLLVITVLSNLVAVQIGGKVLMTKSEYDELQIVKERYMKIETLKQSLQEEFYESLTDEALYDGMMHGLFKAAGDRYTVYYNEEENKVYEANSSGVFAGIGVELTIKDNMIVITRPIKNSPAEKAGILAGDIIVQVEGVDVSEENYDKAVNLIGGEIGSDVIVAIRRDQVVKNYSITRDQIHVEAVRSSELSDKVGYINIVHFDEDTYDEFKTHYESLQAQGIKSLVLDLRDNPGGSLDQCVNIADYMLGKQTIVYTKDRAGNEKYYRSDPRKINLPFVVLINGNSASAAEILTAAIKDVEAGKIVGTKSFGKGIVQTVWKMPDGAGYKITTSKYYTPNGENFHEVGVEPDVIIESDYLINPDEPNEKDDIQLIEALKQL